MLISNKVTMTAGYSTFTQRWSWMGAVLGGLTYVLFNVLLELYFPDHWAAWPTQLLGISYAGWSRLLWIPPLLLLVGLAGVYVHLKEYLGWLGKIGVLLAAIGFGLDILGNLVEFWVYGLLLVPIFGEFRTGSAGSTLGYEISGYGTMFLMVGLLILVTAALRSSFPVRWRILLLTLGLSFASVLPLILLELIAVHAVAYGLSWILLGYFLWKEKLPQEAGFVRGT